MGLRPVLERESRAGLGDGRKDGGGGMDGENNSSTQETCVHVFVSVCVCSQRETVGEV